MKQLIVPIAIIVALIASFVIIDRKEFSRHDDVQTVQNVSPTSNRKPTVSVPETKPYIEVKPVTETKPVEEKPVTETKPVAETTPVAEAKPKTDVKPAETKPVAETKPAEEKPVETKPAETKPVVEAKPGEKLLPAAVPVVTAEEAEKLNEDAKAYALAEKEKREPFHKFYQDTKLDSVCFQGTIRATSIIPDPEKNDYDNCLYALFVEIDSLFSDVTQDTEIACEVIVNVPIMKDKAILANNIFLPGDKVWCTCAEYDTMPQAIQEIQLSDDIQSYEHQQYYPFWIKKISAFSKGGNRNFAKREITILPIQTLPKDEKAASLRKERIQNEIARIEDEIKKHGGSFDTWKEEYKPIAEKYKKLSSEGYKGWINDSFFAAGGSETTYNTKGYIEGIKPYKDYLDKHNIDLIVVRIPTKTDFAVRVLASDDFQENPAWVEHYFESLKNDIEIVDPMPEMWKHRLDFPLFYFYHIPSETHPFEGQAYTSAKVLSEVLKRYDYSQTDQPITLEDSDFKTSQARFLWPEGNEKFNSKENIVFKQTNQNKKTIGNLVVNTGSPFLFLSNSYFWYPQRSLGASVPGYTAFFLQHIPDWFYQDGNHNSMIRNLIADTTALSSRKAVIMVGHPNDWNGSFPPFPKYIIDNAEIITQEKTMDFLSPAIKILDDESFLFTKDEEGITHFTQNPEKEKANKSFRIEFSIPGFDGKKTCMLRINFGTNSYLAINITNSETKDLIDQTTLSPDTNQHADFYIPVSNESRYIFIEFKPNYPNQKFSVKNIELWYY